MYKITKNGKTIVGNNEDYISPNSQFWFEAAQDNKLGVMYMGLLNNFAQGAINEKGLMFDGFWVPYLEVDNTEGKLNIPIGQAIKNVMQSMTSVEEVKSYLETINLSTLTNGQVVFVDRSGTYLIVEGDELLLGDEPEKAFSNFYYSQTESLDQVNLNYFQNGRKFLEAANGNPSTVFCGEVMEKFSQSSLNATQYSTVYDLNALTIRVFLLHDYKHFVDIDLKQALSKGNHKVMIPELFPKESSGFKYYQMYNDAENPTRIFDHLYGKDQLTEEEFLAMGFNDDINAIGYEWLRQKSNPEAAIKIFKYGIAVMPNDADLYDSLGEAYLMNDDWEDSIINYGKSLSLEPDNENAIEKLVQANHDRNKYQEKSFKQFTQIIDRYAENTLSKGNINSLALALYKNGKTYHNYYGELNPNLNNAPDDSTLYEVASISKVFLGSMAAKAVLEKKISIDDDIRTYLGKGFPNLEFEGTPVTIKNLLTHTIGFETPKNLDKVYQKTRNGYYENKAFDYGMEDLLEELKTVVLDKKPGTHYDYNNVGPELVAYILEQVYNKPYKDLLKGFLDDLDMKNTYLQDYDQHKNQLANGYDEDGKRAPRDKNPLLGGAYGILTTLPDLTKFMKFQLEENTPFIKESTRFLFKNGEDDTGYLWDLGIAEKEGFYYQKSGTSNGVQSIVLVCPDTNYGLILIMNNTSDAALDDWVGLYNKTEYDLIEYPKINLWSLLEPAFFENPAEVSKQYKKRSETDNKYFFGANYLNRIAYAFLYDNKIEEAIEVLKLAISEDSQNAYLYDSIGAAYFKAKDYENAMKNYEKSLELNPENSNAKKNLSKIIELKEKK
ncbi:MAG: hypothetical protein Sapg2KO_42480 [Saprospiraceae bacterium]